MSFQKLLTEAIADIAVNGYDSQSRIDGWVSRLRAEAEKSLMPMSVVDAHLRESLGGVYARLVVKGGALKVHKGVGRFTLQRVQPRARAELERRIMMSANLIKLNREAMVNTTVQRFSGWASSIPPGGSDAVDRREVKKHTAKPLHSQSFDDRRVFIDQAHKLAADINNIVATDGGAIALIWKSHWRQAGYNYREDHKERDGLVYAIRGNWAIDKGLMKVGPDGYYDQIDHVGQAVFCRCNAVYLYNLRDLPSNMVTAKGDATITRVSA